MDDNKKPTFEVNDTPIDRQIMARRKARYNCAAATLCGIMAAVTGDSDDDLLKHLSVGFAGGIGKTHEGNCGAILGAVLALGMLSDGDDEKTSRLSAELFNDFKERLGAVSCQDLKKRGEAVPCDLCCLTAGRKAYEILEREGRVSNFQHHHHHDHQQHHD